MTNLGVKPLGRGDEPSEVVIAETKALREYGARGRLIGPINTPEKAREYRRAIIDYTIAFELAQGDKGAEKRGQDKANKLKKLFDSIKLDY